MPKAVAPLDTYDERVAQGLVAAHENATGLPGWLGIRPVEMPPGGYGR